jgi:diguanylate cyclase (GGDEF)-like protein
VAWSGAQWEPVVGGRLLLLATGAVSTLTAPLGNPGLRQWQILAEVAAGMTALLVVSYVVPWAKLGRIATTAFPVAVWLALAVLGLTANGLGSNFVGLIALTYAYLGLTQSAFTSICTVPLAATCYVAAYGGWSRMVAVRIPIAVAVWVLLAVLLAELIANQDRLTDRLHAAAHTDALTGVANRRDLEHRLTTVAPGDTLIICDLDHFKRLNDTQGHTAGDRVLADFGTVLSNSMRDNDYAARYGGEEFALLLPVTDAEDGVATLHRLRTQWAVVHPDVTFSAGIATCLPDRSAHETLIAADDALYAAKAAGRNCDRLASSDSLSHR